MNAYKVCRIKEEEGEMWSYSVWHPSLATEYRMYEWTTPPVGGSFCFSTLAYAEQFVDNRNHLPYVILQCKAEGAIPLPPNVVGIWDFPYPKDTVQAVWDRTICGTDVLTEFWPDGTVTYRRIMPVEVVRYGGENYENL